MVKGNKKILEKGNYGTMSRVLNAERTRTMTTKSNVITTARSFQTNVDLGDSSIYPGGNYLNVSLSAGLDEIYPQGLPKIGENYDQFRLLHAEVFLSVAEDVNGNVPNLTVFSSVDEDDALPTTWDVYRTRKNISMDSVNRSRTLICLGSWKPVANFAVSVNTSSPNNMVPSKNQWFDTSAVSQQFLGLKVHVASPASSVQKFSLFAKISVEWKAQV